MRNHYCPSCGVGMLTPSDCRECVRLQQALRPVVDELKILTERLGEILIAIRGKPEEARVSKFERRTVSLALQIFKEDTGDTCLFEDALRVVRSIHLDHRGYSTREHEGRVAEAAVEKLKKLNAAE